MCDIAQISNVIDATRVSDGIQVSIKTVSGHHQEVTIARLLSSNELLQRPTNHCVPVFDVLNDPFDASKAMMVMPYFIHSMTPSFEL